MLSPKPIIRVCPAACALLLLPLAAPAQSGGLAPEWDVRKDLAALAAHAQRLKPMLEEIKPVEWVRQGAPDAYVSQLASTRAQLEALGRSTDKLMRQPDLLTAALEAFLRVQSLDALLRSLVTGVRKYQNPALADLLQSAVADGAASQDKLRQYLVDLAAQKEQELQVMDREAQRCRAFLSRQPPPTSAPKKQERQ